MKKISNILISLALVLALVMSFAACSANANKDNNSTSDSAVDNSATLLGILDIFKADEQYISYKSMYPNTTFEEKVDGNSIVLNISGKDGIEGNYEYKLDGEYLTYTYKTDSEDYLGISFFTFLMTAADEYLGMVPGVVTGYISGCDAFDIESKYYLTETDEAAGTTTTKLYVAGKYDMPELDTMYINEKSLEYTNPLTENDINGVVNVGKIRMIYYGSKDSADIIFSEYGTRDDLTYQSMMTAVAKLQPNGYDTFAKEYTELKEVEGDGYKVSFGIDNNFIAEHEFEVEEGCEYTAIHFGE